MASMKNQQKAQASEERLMRFSFKYLDVSHPAFDVRDRDGSYFRLLLARLKDLSQLRMEEFFTSRSPSLRIHQINFRDVRVAEKSFGVLSNPNADDFAWQFALSANEHGRVHGFVFDNTFYVRWLDPDHKLYPGG
jgi:hypothetical protein